MSATKRLLVISALIAMLTLAGGGQVVALSPYYPLADTYTDLAEQTANYGADIYTTVNASNLAGCVETTYSWYKFAVPATGRTIGQASLTLAIILLGSGTADLELRSTTDTSWTEGDSTTGIAWATQPALDPTVLAVFNGATIDNAAVFSGTTFANYLDARQGQTVSLVVRARCAGSVSASVALNTQSREHPSGSGARLDIATPTNVTLQSVIAAPLSSDNSLPLVGGLLLAALGGVLVFARRRRHA